MYMLVARSSAQRHSKYGSFVRIVAASTNDRCGVRAPHEKRIIRDSMRGRVCVNSYSKIGRPILAGNNRCSAFVQLIQHTHTHTRSQVLHRVEGIRRHGILNVWNTMSMHLWTSSRCGWISTCVFCRQTISPINQHQRNSRSFVSTSKW